MEKELSQMSIEELWELFPIFLTEHKPIWNQWFDEEKNGLKRILPQNQAMRISHIGSTSIGTIWAKPIIDILLEIPADVRMEAVTPALVNHGYICMSKEKCRISFNKGYTKSGFAEKVFHLHLRYIGDNDELYFRDYLIENKEIALEYEKLKLRLWKDYEHNRDGYTDAKSDFVVLYTQEAKRIYSGRYC